MNADPTAPLQPAEDDLALARRAAGGDRGIFEMLMRRYNRRLYRMARAYLRDDAEAKDALQDAYLSAYRSIGQYRGDAALATWFSRLVLNACAARKRRSTRRENIIPLVNFYHHMNEISVIPDSDQGPENLLARTQIRNVLEQKVSELPEIFRVVFVLRSVEEMSVEEIADSLSIPQETVRSRHFRAKGMLREALANEIDLAEGQIYEFGGFHCDRIVASVLSRLDDPDPAAPCPPFPGAGA
ncbi:MAG: RNA polymerase sigma factor [Steroidobacteraceae bacterium]